MDSLAATLGTTLTDMVVCDVIASLVDQGLLELGPDMPVGLIRAAVLETLAILPESVGEHPGAQAGNVRDVW